MQMLSCFPAFSVILAGANASIKVTQVLQMTARMAPQMTSTGSIIVPVRLLFLPC